MNVTSLRVGRELLPESYTPGNEMYSVTGYPVGTLEYDNSGGDVFPEERVFNTHYRAGSDVPIFKDIPKKTLDNVKFEEDINTISKDTYFKNLERAGMLSNALATGAGAAAGGLVGAGLTHLLKPSDLNDDGMATMVGGGVGSLFGAALAATYTGNRIGEAYASTAREQAEEILANQHETALAPTTISMLRNIVNGEDVHNKLAYYIDHPGTFTKQASAKSECESIMSKLYEEEPSYWPHGLAMNMMDGGAYMIRQASTNDAVGFVGWQERKDPDGAKVGYYAIGVLPEHRGNGFAKKAVADMIRMKSAGVDRVRAMIVSHNEPSMNLAKKLGVEIKSVQTS